MSAATASVSTLGTHERTCVVCGGAGSKHLYSIPPRRLVACTSCGHEYVDPVESNPWRCYFSPDDAVSVATRIDVVFVSAVLKRYGVHHGRLLDLGCGQGRVVRGLVEAGWDPRSFYLVDRSVEDVEVAARACPGAGTVVHDAREPLPFSIGFDCILMVEFLEHLVDPAAVIANALDRLRPGGVLIARGMPNNLSIDAFIARENWRMRRFRNHHHFFSPRSFSALLARYACIRHVEFGAFLQPGFAFYTVERLAQNLGLDEWWPVDHGHVEPPSPTPMRERLRDRIIEVLRAASFADYPYGGLLQRGWFDGLTIPQLESRFNQLYLDYRLSPDFSVTLSRV